MTVLLNRSYGNYASGTVVELPASTEAALIQQSIAQASAAAPTTGNVSTQEFTGTVGIAAGQTSLVVSHPLVTPQSKVSAVVSQAAADGTLLYIARVVPAAGSFTIYGNAAATATTIVDWSISNTGLTPNQ